VEMSAASRPDAAGLTGDSVRVADPAIGAFTGVLRLELVEWSVRRYDANTRGKNK
jgi:hypothetical protein